MHKRAEQNTLLLSVRGTVHTFSFGLNFFQIFSVDDGGRVALCVREPTLGQI